MKIGSTNYSLTSSHLATTLDESSESLRSWVGNRRPDFESRPGATASSVSVSAMARASLAADIQAAMAALPAPPHSTQSQPAVAVEDASDATNDPYLQLIKLMIEMLIGHSIRTFSAQELQRPATPLAATGPQPAVPTASQQEPPASPAGFGIEYDYHAVHQEYEQTRITAEGSIKTSDGMEITFKLDLSMTRSYYAETSISLRAGDAVRKDPLVLNFNGTAAQLSDQRFSFDLDDDGRDDNLALLTGGSGYLALDRNSNGRIDSGSELFGPATNSGFGELSALDDDHNGWIDESDSAFAALRIWTPDAKSDGTLETLQQRKVGAIALTNVASPFELRGTGNSNLGAITASGIFLADDGGIGTVQEIDLTV